MLTVAKVTGVQAAGYADYLQGKTTATQAGDYYLKDGERVEAPGRWIAGASSVAADPAVRVTGEQLRLLMDVRRPDTGTALRPVGSTGEAVAALDATFSAPKSVSAVWALADPNLRERVERAHETAVDRAIQYAVAQVPMVRMRIDRATVIHAKARALVATGWRHTTARAVDGPPDPQLHTHVLLHAAARRDGQLAAIDSRPWLTHRRELGAAYRTELVRELTSLGFAIQRATGRGHRYFEITGIPTALTDRWSSRHHQVQEAIRSRLDSRRAELQAVIDTGGPAGQHAHERLAQLNATAQLSAGEDRLLTQSTRIAKRPVTRTDLDEHWTQTARQLGVTHHDVEELRAADRLVEELDRISLLDALTEHDAILTRSHARAIALEQSAGTPIHDALTQLARMRDDGQLLTLDDGSLTTREHRHREHATVALARRLASGDVDPIPEALISRHAVRLDEELRRSGGALSEEQRQALWLACGEGQLVMIEGQAGTGKSTVLTGVARAHQDAGQHIIITSTAALAAQRLADELTASGVRNPAAHFTVSLQHAVNDARVILDPATTIIHDEAALASTRELDQLLESIEESGARLILVGDPRQSHAVGAGGLWPDIEHAARVQQAHVQLTRNLRAQDPNDARDQQRFRDGEHETALEGYAHRDRLHLHPGQQAAEDAALDAAREDQRAGRHTLVIAQTSNDHLDELNARAQAIRHQDGQLGPGSIPLTGRPYRLQAGDHIQLRASIRHPGHGTLRNGTTAIITTLDPDAGTATLTLSDGHDVTLPRQELDQAKARLAYVQHPFPAQGTTSDTTHLIIAEHPTQEGTYVALTRARTHTHLYAATDQLDPEQPILPQLAEHVSHTDPDLPSIAYPLAHEQRVQRDAERESHSTHTGRPTRRFYAQPDQTDPPGPRKTDAATAPATRAALDASQAGTPDPATAITAYRTKYAIPDNEPRPLGPEPPAGAFRQRLDRRHAAHDALNTIRDDGRRDADQLHEQLRQIDEPTGERDANTIAPDP